MTMHLEGPWLTTTGKVKGKRKWPSAEAKRRSEQLEAEWQQRLAKMNKMAPRFSASTTPTPKKTVLDTSPRIPPGRETPHIRSLDTGWVACTKAADKTYTGTKVKGIGTMHKSNAVPIFSDEEAVDISKMRR